MTASLHFTLDAQTKTEVPAFADAELSFDGSNAVPHSGDTVAFAAHPAHAFVVKERRFAYDDKGGLTITCHLALASERSI